MEHINDFKVGQQLYCYYNDEILLLEITRIIIDREGVKYNLCFIPYILFKYYSKLEKESLDRFLRSNDMPRNDFTIDGKKDINLRRSAQGIVISETNIIVEESIHEIKKKIIERIKINSKNELLNFSLIIN